MKNQQVPATRPKWNWRNTPVSTVCEIDGLRGISALDDIFWAIVWNSEAPIPDSPEDNPCNETEDESKCQDGGGRCVKAEKQIICSRTLRRCTLIPISTNERNKWQVSTFDSNPTHRSCPLTMRRTKQWRQSVSRPNAGHQRYNTSRTAHHQAAHNLTLLFRDFGSSK